MTRARNRVIAGAYEGKAVGKVGSVPVVFLKITQPLYLNRETVAGVVPLDDESEMSVVSAATRGFIGEMLLGPVGLAAAVTAKRHEVHIVGIEFRDGERSVIEIDSELYKLLAASCF